MPSMSSPGKATIIQALEKAVWPVRPIIHESMRVTRVPERPWRLALSAAISPPAPAPTTSTSVSIRIPSSFAIARHQGRGRFLTEGCTSTICSGQKISQLKQVMQCSRNLITGSSLRVRPATSGATDGLHVDHVGRATSSQMPQLVQRLISISRSCGAAQPCPTTMPIPVIHSGTR